MENTYLFSINLRHLVDTLHNIQKLFYGSIVNEKLHLTQKLLILEYFVIKNIKHFHTYPGRFCQTLGTSRNYFRLVHLGSELHL